MNSVVENTLSNTLQKNKFGRTEKQQREFSKRVGQKIYISRCNKKLPYITHQIAEKALEYVELFYRAEEDLSLYGIINDNLSPFSKESFCRWGDRNNVNEISKGYINKAGIPLDVQAQQMIGQYHLNMDEQDLIECIVNFLGDYPKKRSYKSNDQIELDRIASEFKELTGIKAVLFYCEYLVDVYYNHTPQKIDPINFPNNFSESAWEQVEHCPF